MEFFFQKKVRTCTHISENFPAPICTKIAARTHRFVKLWLFSKTFKLLFSWNRDKSNINWRDQDSLTQKKGVFIRKIEIERWDGMEFALFWNEFKITLAMLRIEADNSNVLEIWLLSAILSQTKIATHFLAINPTLRLVSCVLFIGSAGD